MKKILLSAFAAFVLVSVSCFSPFAGTVLPSDQVSAAQNAAGSKNANGGIYGVATTSTLTNASDQVVRVSFYADGKIDTSSLTAVHFYKLGASAASDGGHSHSSEIDSSATVLSYSSDTGITDVDFTMNLSSASNPIQMYVDPTVLTASNGLLKLNLDNGAGDIVQGESGDDDYVEDLTVTGGTAAGGAVSDPLRPFGLNTAGTVGVGDTTYTAVYGPATALNDSANYKSTFDDAIKLQKFNLSNLAWDTVSTTTSYSTSTGNYVISLPATANQEVYRLVAIDPSNLRSQSTIRGYVTKESYNQTLDEKVYWTQSVGSDITYNTSFTIAGLTAFDSSSHNGTVQLVFGGLGTLGLNASTVTKDNLRLYNQTAGTYVPWTSAVVTQSVPGSAQKNDMVILTLDPAYTNENDTLRIHVGPGLIDRQTLSASSDDLKLGDWTNTTNLPLGYSIVTPSGSPTI